MLHLSEERSKSALAVWRDRVKTWKPNNSAIFRFLRNDSPSKSTVLIVDDAPTNDPHKTGLALHHYWTSLQLWPSDRARERAWESLEDSYSLTLPNKPYVLDVQAETMMDQAKRHGRSSPGLDAWTFEQLRLLPKAAWTGFKSLPFLTWSILSTCVCFPPSYLRQD